MRRWIDSLGRRSASLASTRRSLRSLLVAATLLGCLASGGALAQSSPQPLGQEGIRDRVGGELVDRLDIIWVEQGRVFFSFGRGKLFGIDVREAMGNPAAMKQTTEVKWENFLAGFNSHIVLLASRYPAQLYGEQGVVVSERDVFTNQVTRPFSDFVIEEYVDLTGYLLTSSALGRANEEETMRAFELIGYLGGATGAAWMLSENNVTLPVTFRLQKGEFRGRTYDVRVRVRGDELGFGSDRYPDLSTRVSWRVYNFSEATLDLAWKDVLRDETETRQRAAYSMRRYGTYYVGAEQLWDAVRQRTEYGWLVGAQADVISPALFEETRVRTGVEYHQLGAEKLPERYLLDVYHHNRFLRGRDFVIQARWIVSADYADFQGVGGELRASWLVGSNVPKYSKAYSRADWDRFARIYALATADTFGRSKRTWGMRLVYAAPFEVDRAMETIWNYVRERMGNEVEGAVEAPGPPLGG